MIWNKNKAIATCVYIPFFVVSFASIVLLTIKLAPVDLREPYYQARVIPLMAALFCLFEIFFNVTERVFGWRSDREES